MPMMLPGMQPEVYMPDIEASEIDLSYQELRLKDAVRERFLLASIAEHGVREALWGICRRDPARGEDGPPRYVLLDGFKRYRCAKQLGHTTLPWQELGSDDVEGMLALLYSANARGLHLLEQARLVDCLHRNFTIGVSEIARRLERSAAWVSVRLGMLSEMGQVTRDAVFSGRFPARSYLYSVRHFTRVKGVTRPEAERFVGSVSGHGLSGKQVDTLAQAYFQGNPAIRSQIEEGKLAYALETIRTAQDERARDPGALAQLELGLLRDLEIATSSSLRITRRVGSHDLKSPTFFAQAELLSGGLARLLPDLESSLKSLYVRCREKKNGLAPPREGRPDEADRKLAPN